MTVPDSTDTDRLAETAERRRNQHCMNCGDTRGGPLGHETSECTYDGAAAATRRQLDHASASMRTNRAGWTDQQYLDDARRLFGDVDGSVLDLVNGHVSAMLHEIDRLLSELEAAQARLEAVQKVITPQNPDWQPLSERYPEHFTPDSPEEAARKKGWGQGVDLQTRMIRRALGLGEEADDA